MRLAIQEAHQLVMRVMAALGHDAADAGLIADHLIDCELRGLSYGGLARAISIAERIQRVGDRRRPVRMLRETAVSARIDGGDHIGYVVAHYATRVAIQKAEAAGIAVIGASDTWYTGMLSYYAEMAAAQGLVSIIASNASPWVAPYGASEGRLGTNPICFGFPSADEPVIYDIGTSAIMHAEVMQARRLGDNLPEGAAFDSNGQPTRDPAAALTGAFAAWGDHKGSGLGIAVQLTRHPGRISANSAGTRRLRIPDRRDAAGPDGAGGEFSRERRVFRECGPMPPGQSPAAHQSACRSTARARSGRGASPKM